MDEAMRIRCESMPLDKEIKGSQRKGKPGLQCSPAAMRNFFEMTDATHHRKHGLHQHPGIPEPAITQFEITWIALFGMERRITQDDHLLFIGLNQGMESGIGGIWRRYNPNRPPSPTD